MLDGPAIYNMPIQKYTMVIYYTVAIPWLGLTTNCFYCLLGYCYILWLWFICFNKDRFINQSHEMNHLKSITWDESHEMNHMGGITWNQSHEMSHMRWITWDELHEMNRMRWITWDESHEMNHMITNTWNQSHEKKSRGNYLRFCTRCISLTESWLFDLIFFLFKSYSQQILAIRCFYFPKI